MLPESPLESGNPVPHVILGFVLTSSESQSIAVLGLGYIGCVTAACLAKLGHRVYGVDKDPLKVTSILEGRAPFYEPGLEEAVRETVASGLFSASTDLAPSLAEADIALVCVGTPSARNGNLSLEQLERVLGDVQRCLAGRDKPLILAIRSTVFPGTTEELTGPLVAENPLLSVVSNPEFLREGVAMRDFMEPALVVVGGSDPAAVRRVADIYAPLGLAPCLVSLRTAEMIKYCCNAFHALKIGFANEVGALAERLSVSPYEVMETLCSDTRLNISTAYLKPGFAFGGSCLPKDLRALTYRAMRMDLKLPLLESVLSSNQRHLERAVEQVLDFPGLRVGVFGLAFKEETDDLRESPVVAAIEQWTGKGKEVRVCDPHIRLDSIYGSNRSFLFTALPHIGRLLAPGLEDVLGWCDCLVLAQKPDAETARRIARSGRLLFDLVGARLQREAWAG
jgi:GDP-mannose 6-dehydrogenase